MNYRILITGALGQLGSEFKYLSSFYQGYDFVYTDYDTLDITNLDALDQFVRNESFNFILNCAAYTNVDKAEDEIEQATRVNSLAVENLVTVSEKYSIKLVHISTDYVFDGTSFLPLKESDETNPIGVYGKTKRKGEESIIQSKLTFAIIRTAWLYSTFGNNFLKTISKYAKERDELTVISDQIGTPTYARDLAAAILEILPNLTEETKGVYHFSNEGVASWYDFANEIVNELKLNCKIIPIETKDYVTKAVRPSYSVLNKTKIKEVFDLYIPYWRSSLKKCIQDQ